MIGVHAFFCVHGLALDSFQFSNDVLFQKQSTSTIPSSILSVPSEWKILSSNTVKSILVYQHFEKEINEHKKTGRLPSTFQLTDLKHYEALSRIRSRFDRLSYLRSLMSIISTLPTFAVPEDSTGVHAGFLCPYRVLRQSDLVELSAWNYLKAQRLNENLLLNCSGISPEPLAQLIIDMRAKFNLINEPWWPILSGISDEVHEQIIGILKRKYQLHGVHLSTWETKEHLPNRSDLTLICANRGETIFELDPNVDYIVQIDADERHCCLGFASNESQQIYKNIVKIESRLKSFSLSRRILTDDLFAILTSLKLKGLFYKQVRKDKDDENYNMKSTSSRRGLISH